MFSRANPFEESVNAATNENLTVENWELILAVTDKLSRATSESARDCISAIEKRLNNRNPNVQLYAVALTEALVKNCDITVHREISSRSFTNTLTRLVHDRTIHAKVRTRILEFIQMCSFEFRADSTLGLMNEVYQSLRAEGIQFPSPQKPKKEFTQSELDKQKEEEEFQLALALSLSESENRPTYKAATPASTNNTTTTTTAKSNEEEGTPKISRVRALYDFQPTEQGELGFQKGDIIRVIESVYRDWWKGELRGKTGIFPVNYVEKIVDPSPSDLLKEAAMEEDVLNETRNIDRLLDMLSNPDPRVRDSFSDNDELQNLYNTSLSIRPKLIKLIEKYSLKKDELVALNEKFMQARTMYDGMLSNSIAKYSTAPTGPYNGYPTSTTTPTSYNYDSQQQQQQQQPYGGYGYPSNPPSSYTPTQSQQQQPYGYQQSPAPTQSTPIQQHQQPQQQNSFGYSSDAASTAPQQQQQQQPQQSYDYNNQYQQPTFDQQQVQQPQNTGTADYSAQAYTSAPPPTQEGVYSPQQQQNYAAYPPSNTTPSEGYAPYTPQVANQQQQQQYPPYAGQPQQQQQQTYQSY